MRTQGVSSPSRRQNCGEGGHGILDKLLQDGRRKGDGLAGPGPAPADAVPALEDLGDTRLLDGRGALDGQARQRLHEPWLQAEGVEGGMRVSGSENARRRVALACVGPLLGGGLQLRSLDARRRYYAATPFAAFSAPSRRARPSPNSSPDRTPSQSRVRLRPRTTGPTARQNLHPSCLAPLRWRAGCRCQVGGYLFHAVEVPVGPEYFAGRIRTAESSIAPRTLRSLDLVAGRVHGRRCLTGIVRQRREYQAL